MRQPLVSIVIPSYNHGQYIRTAIDSVLAQTYENFELIIVDDGSKDDSHSVISEYADHPKIRTILNTENCGQSAALNQALAKSKGEYIALLPSDDWFLPQKTSLQVAKMEASGEDVGVVYAAGARYYEDTNETVTVKLPVHTGWIAQDLIALGNFIYPITPLYRREVFEKVQPSEQFKAEGEAIHLRIALLYQYEYVDDIVAVMRDHTYNIGKNASVMLEEITRHREWYFSLPDLPQEIRELKSVSISRLYRIKGMQLIFDQKDRKAGRSTLNKLALMDPFAFARYPKVLIAWALTFFPTVFISYLTSLKKSLRSR